MDEQSILRSVLDNLGDGVAVADERGRLVLFNPAAERILGLGLIDAGPERWSQFYGLYLPDTETPVPADELPLARAVAGHESRDVDLFVRNPQREGGVFIRVTATPLRDADGTLRGGVAVFRDISERRWAEAVLRDSEARFRAIVEATASALIIIGGDRSVREFNPQAERIFGVPRGEALGQSFLELCLAPEYRVAVEQDLRGVLAGETPPGFEVPLVSRDGAERTVLWSFSRLTESDQQDPVVIATGHDITERRQAERARRMHELAAHLESAREAERGHVAREIHDELGQALTGLKLEVSYLSRRSGPTDGELRDRLVALGGMIDQTIAAVRRISADLRPHILDELGLLEAIRWQASDFTERSDIACSVELPEEPLELSADRATALYRIVQEALTNVARHAGATEVVIRATSELHRIVLVVQDNGRGIGDPGEAGAQSFGLLGMEERARMFGGTLEVRAGDRGGTTVTARIPI